MTEHVELQQLVDFSPSIQGSLPNLMENKRPLLRRCPYLGIILAMLSSFFFSICTVIVKSLVNIDPILLALFRFIGVLLPTLPVVIYNQEPVFPKGKRLLLVTRSMVGTIGLILSFYAFRNMPIADASVIVFSVPVFVGCLAKIFLNEPYGMWDVFSVTLTLFGVVFIIHPPLIFGDDGTETSESTFKGAVAAFISTILVAKTYILLRVLKGIHFSVTMFNFGGIATLQTLLYAFIFGVLCMPNCGAERFLVVSLAVFSYLGQILLTMSLQMEQAGPVAVARSADILFAFMWQILIFNETPSMYTLMGALLVLVSVSLVGVRKWAVSLPADSALKAKLGMLAV